MKTVKIGIIGCGNISSAYLRTVQTFDILECVALADLDLERARARAEEFGVPKACTTEELLADPEIELVVNLTIPAAHFEVSMAIIEAGKHVYTEKPLAIIREDGAKILDAAKAKGVRVGCAPGTFIGGGLQTCRKLLDDGAIGRPVAAAAFMMSHGAEHWHPDPAFLYQIGAGPMFDMGPYYLTALTTLLGPITRVAGSAGIQISPRTITSKPKYGEQIIVRTPDHVTGTFTFASGVIGTIITSTAVWAASLPRIEIYGTDGTLSLPDPNSLGGPVKLAKAGESEFTEIPLTHGHADSRQMWGIGVADMAHALRSGRAHRASGAQGYHVLDLMQAFLDSSRDVQYAQITSTIEQPKALPLGLAESVLDD